MFLLGLGVGVLVGFVIGFLVFRNNIAKMKVIEADLRQKMK